MLGCVRRVGSPEARKPSGSRRSATTAETGSNPTLPTRCRSSRRKARGRKPDLGIQKLQQLHLRPESGGWRTDGGSPTPNALLTLGRCFRSKEPKMRQRVRSRRAMPNLAPCFALLQPHPTHRSFAEKRRRNHRWTPWSGLVPHRTARQASGGN
jgi:hypothetical protein